jgi:uridylate kinase
VQVELSAVRVLLELLGFLLNGMVTILGGGEWSPKFFTTEATEGHRVEHAGASVI